MNGSPYAELMTPAGRRPRALLLSPYVPKLQGGGTMMRAGFHLESLAQSCDVDLLVVNFAASQELGDFCERLNSCSSSAQMYAAHGLQYRRYRAGFRSSLQWLNWLRRTLHGPFELLEPDGFEREEIIDLLGNRQFDLIFAFRLCMGPLAHDIARMQNAAYGVAPKIVLDLDDIESEKLARVAEYGRDRVGRLWSISYRLYAAKAKKLERREIPRADQVYVCSDKDAELVRTRHPSARTRILPNGIRMTGRAAKPNGTSGRHVLFVGSLDYLPNEDGIRWFVSEVYAPLKARVEDVTLHIVGRSATAGVLQLAAQDPSIQVFSNVPSVDEFYGEAALAISPIRFGGGTRIKILEAFSYDVPVVSTTIGCEGLLAESERELLIADDPAGFAECCARVLTDPSLSRRLAEEGRRAAEEYYSEAAIGAQLSAHLQELGLAAS